MKNNTNTNGTLTLQGLVLDKKMVYISRKQSRQIIIYIGVIGCIWVAISEARATLIMLIKVR